MLKHLTSYVCFTLSAAVLSPLCLTASEMHKKDEAMIASFFNNKKQAVASNSSDQPPPPQNDENTDEECPPHVHPYSAYIKHIEANGIGYKQGYTTIGTFITPFSFDSGLLPFADLRLHFFNNWKKAANAGIGVRYLTDSDYVFGIGAYYDYRQTNRFHYNQVSLALEAQGDRWEARLNGYLPVGSKSHVKHRESKVLGYEFDHFSGHNLFYSTTTSLKEQVEYAMWGLDSEFGGHLMEPQENYTVYAGIGPYYYKRDSRHAFGGKVRVEARITPYIVLEVSDSYDNLFHNNVQGQVTFRVPFGGKMKMKKRNMTNSCDQILAMEARMVQPMYRQEIIVSSKRTKHHITTSDPIAISVFGTPLTFQFVNNTTTGGDGTFENPYSALATASSNSNPGDILYVFEGDGTTTNYNEGVTLFDNQQLLGSGNVQTVSILANNQVATIAIPSFTSGQPNLTNLSASAVVLMSGDNNVVSGFNITPTGTAQGIFANGATNRIQNETVINNTITMTSAATGISFTSIAGTNVISNNTITGGGVSNSGIIFDLTDDLKATVLVQNNTISGTDGIGDPILLRTNITGSGSAQLTALVTGNTVINNVVLNSSIFLSSNSVGTINATLLNNTISNNTTANGFSIATTAEAYVMAQLENNTITGNLSGVLFIPDNNSSITCNIINNNISNNSGGGIASSGTLGVETTGALDYFIQGNTISHNGGAGIDLDSLTAQQHLTIDSNIIFGNVGTSFIFTNEATGGMVGTTCLKFTNNESGISTVTNNNTATGITFTVEPYVGNTGTITEIGPGHFTHVIPGTCAD